MDCRLQLEETGSRCAECPGAKHSLSVILASYLPMLGSAFLLCTASAASFCLCVQPLLRLTLHDLSLDLRGLPCPGRFPNARKT